MKPSQSLLRNIFIGAFIALALLLSVMAVGLKGLRERNSAFEIVARTFDVISDLRKVEGDITELGRSQRGYILTSQKIHKKNFDEIIPVIRSTIQTTKNKISENSFQQKNFLQLENLTAKIYNLYLENMVLVEQGFSSKASDKVKEGLGEDFAIQIVNLIDEMISHEEDLLRLRLSRHKEARDLANLMTLIGTALAFTFILLSFVLLLRQSKKRIIAEDELNKTSALQKAILDSAGLPIISTDIAGHIKLFNSAAEKLLGYKAEEVTGKSVGMFHLEDEIRIKSQELIKHYPDADQEGDVFVYKARTGNPEPVQWTYKKKDGSLVSVSLTLSALRDKSGNITGFVGVASDITDQLAYEKALIFARDEAQAGTQAKSEFLANMSHEIRTPMNAILGMAELLRESSLNNEQRKYVDIFQRAGESLLTIINDILDLSKIESGIFELDRASFSLGEIVEKSLEIMSLRAHQKDLELIVDIDDDLHDQYFGDGHRIHQILVNLLGNAIKFTKQGEVLLRIKGHEKRPEQREIFIEILDTGIGMSDKQLDKLFERFNQADTSITKEYGGTGLGLNITRKLVELMKGTIEVQSALNMGSKFTVKLWLEEDNVSVPVSSKVSFEGKRFLIIDDNATNRYIFRRILEGQGAIAEEAQSGNEGLEMIRKNREENKTYSLVLLDSRMPGKDGFEVAQELRNSGNGHQLVMMLTSDNRPGDMAKARMMGLKSYLVKPVMKNTLLREIEQILFFEEEKVILPQSQNEEQSSTLHILLVDDNDENRLIIRAFLKPMKWKITEAKNGVEAITLFQQNHFDIILMDMQMPVMDGYTATREIRKKEHELNKRPIAIVALTAYALQEEIEKSFQAGCNDHLSKPVSKNDLLKMIENYTGPVELMIDHDLSDLIPDYLRKRAEEVQIMKKQLEAGDFKGLTAIAHKLRGSAGSYGFSELSFIGKEVEDKSYLEDSVSIHRALIQYEYYLSRIKINYSRSESSE